MHGERFVDVAPEAVVATLLDEARYLCSARTMYRLLAAHHEVQERRHPSYAAPELLATSTDRGSRLAADSLVQKLVRELRMIR